MGEVVSLHHRKALKLAEKISVLMEGMEIVTCMEACSLVASGLVETVFDQQGRKVASQFKTELVDQIVELTKEF